MVRHSLRWKILLFTVLPLAALGTGTLWSVNRALSRQVNADIRADLTRAGAVFEQMLAARGEELAVAGRTIVRDPKFFSILTLPGGPRSEEVRNTVMGVAQDFNTITRQDLFDVLDQDGNVLAATEPATETGAIPPGLLKRALAGEVVSGIVVRSGSAYQVALAPALVGGRVAGCLLLGSRVGQGLAERLRQLTRSEVTFVSLGRSSGSTLAHPEDLAGLLARLAPGANKGGVPSEVTEVRGRAERYLTLVRAIPGAPADEGQFYVLQRSLDAETLLLQSMKRSLAQLGFLALLAALLAGLAISRSITRPIQHLVRVAEEMERGNYEYPVEALGRDEVGYLGRRFADMRTHLKNYVVRLEEMTRLKSNFLSVASHELRTPITVIQGYQELLAARILGPLSDAQEEAIRAIGKSAVTLTKIAEDATRMAQIDQDKLAIERTHQDVSQLVRGAMRSALGAAQGRSVSVHCETSSDVGTACVDGNQLHEAICQLIKNAIRFTPDGGDVLIQTTRQVEEVRIEVRDTGVGIGFDRQREIFEKPLANHDALQHHSSNTLEFNSAGLGMGLSIARGIAEAHCGRIALESAPGQGSVFTLIVPDGMGAQLQEAA